MNLSLLNAINYVQIMNTITILCIYVCVFNLKTYINRCLFETL